MNLNLNFDQLEYDRCLSGGCFGGTVNLFRYGEHRLVIKSVPFESLKLGYKSVLREHAVLSQASHPRILQYYGFFETVTAWNLVTEYVEKGNLADFIERHAAQQSYLSQLVILAKLGDMVQALAYLHQRMVIHRDLKPANVLIDADNRLKLADFGIAKMLSYHSAMPEEEFNMTITGTPCYMAPEIASGKRYSYKSDIWPLGIILYELCTLKHPFIEQLAAARGDQSKRMQLPPLGDIRERYGSDRLMRLCEQMLRPNPRKRATLQQVHEQMEL